MKTKAKVIDLVRDKSGVFVPKRELDKPVKKNSCVDMSNAFLEGVDIGLDFLEAIKRRLDRLIEL
ncbi:MAG: hypothetical protein QXT45_06285 [Candidatus Bilamarchaeaceae archaeon]